MDEYDGRQFVGIDLHRRRSVIVRQSESGEQLSAGVEAEAVPVPSGGRGRGEDRREAVTFPGSGAAAGRLGVMGERE